MEPKLGWVWLSQSERMAAEASLDDASLEGTRDELGFGVIHFAYADLFFPGTSVQHTSLRYVWFIAWALEEMAQRSPGGDFPEPMFREIEDRTGHRLIEHYGRGDRTGIIGGRVLRKGGSPVSKPSAIYWSALRTWGLLTPLPSTGIAPYRGDLDRCWDQLTRRDRLEVDAVARGNFFLDPPPMPAGWSRKRGALDFELDAGKSEGERILVAWSKLGHPDEAPLLSRLAARRRCAPDALNSRVVRQLCTDDEKRKLDRADQAASLVCIARALYVAMVGDLKRTDSATVPAPDTMLATALADHADKALTLDLDELQDDVTALGGLRPLLAATQEWLSSDRGDYSAMRPIFLAREFHLKGDRAFLLQGSVDRRAQWSPFEPSPLTYRWEKVARFLDELAPRA